MQNGMIGQNLGRTGNLGCLHFIGCCHKKLFAGLDPDLEAVHLPHLAREAEERARAGRLRRRQV